MKNNNVQMKDIMKRIKDRRNELGLSFQQLADLTGLSKSTLQRYETGGIRNIPLDKLTVLAEALQITPEWILGWNRKMDELDKIVYSLYPDFRPGVNYISDVCSSGNSYSGPLDSNADEQKLINNFRKLNSKGKVKLLEYSDDLVNSGNYILNEQKEKHA